MALHHDIVAEALIERGYAVLRDQGALMPMAEEIFEEGRTFFRSDDAAKLAAASPSKLEGFRPMGSEYSETVEQPDLCESFSVWRSNAGDPKISAWAAPNRLHGAMSRALPEYARVANALLEALRLRLNPSGLPVDVSKASYLQVNHYRPRDFGRGFLQELHEDGHVLTIHKATGDGLEIQAGGRFLTIDMAENDFLLLPGSLLTLLTGGTIAPLFHRVRNDRRSDARQSLLYFINPSLIEETPPWIENESNRGVNIRSVALSCIGAR